MTTLCVFLSIACGYDYQYRRIPNGLIAAMAAFGVGWRMWGGGVKGVGACLAGMFLVMILLYPLFRIGGLGAGDVKLLGAAAGYLPLGKVLVFLFVSLLIAAMISLRKIWKEDDFGKRMQRLSGYLSEVMESGWRRYPEQAGGKHMEGVCLSGPVLVSALLHWGGVY